MTGLIVLGVIVLVIAAIMLVPVGADVSYIGGNFSLSAKVCGLRLRLIPRKPAEEPSEPKKQKEKKHKPKEEAAAKPGKKFKPDFNRDELLSLVKAVLRGLGKFGKLTVDKFMLHFVSAGDDQRVPPAAQTDDAVGAESVADEDGVEIVIIVGVERLAVSTKLIGMWIAARFHAIDLLLQRALEYFRGFVEALAYEGDIDVVLR